MNNKEILYPDLILKKQPFTMIPTILFEDEKFNKLTFAHLRILKFFISRTTPQSNIYTLTYPLTYKDIEAHTGINHIYVKSLIKTLEEKKLLIPMYCKKIKNTEGKENTYISQKYYIIVVNILDEGEKLKEYIYREKNRVEHIIKHKLSFTNNKGDSNEKA